MKALTKTRATLALALARLAPAVGGLGAGDEPAFANAAAAAPR